MPEVNAGPSALIAIAGIAERYRLVASFCVSIAFHAGVLTLQPGGGLQGAAVNVTQARQAGQGSPSPIIVMLAPYRLQPAIAEVHSAAAPNFPLKRQPRASSPAVADTGAGNGGLAEEAASQLNDVARTYGLPVDEYFDADTVSKRAAILSNLEFDLAELESIAGDGKAVFTLFINDFGHVDKVEIEASGGIDAKLLGAVAQQFGNAVYAPASIDGTPVKSRMRVEILLRPLLWR